MKLHQILQNVMNNKIDLSNFEKTSNNAQSLGTIVEENVLKLLVQDDTYKLVESVVPNKICEKLIDFFPTKDEFIKFKETMKSYDSKETLYQLPGISKHLGFNNVVIPQPLSSQSYPDFMLIKDDVILPIEIKSSNESGKKPTWNAGLPRSKTIYIFSVRKMEETTFFSGDSYINEDQRKQVFQILENAKNYVASEFSKIEYDNFEPYVRRMYNQRFSSFDETKRTKYEIETVSFLVKNNF